MSLNSIIRPDSDSPTGTSIRFLIAPAILSLWCILVPAAGGQGTNITLLTAEHCDFLILYEPHETNGLRIVVRDTDRRINYQTNEVALVVAESAKFNLPANTPFGNEGDPIWILPQSQDPNLLYLGFSAERIPSGVFSRPFNCRLKAVEGPGDFFAWQANEFGGLNVKMNSRDGIGDDDRTSPIVGSHEHFNWGFTTPGVYRVTFQVDGQRVGETTNIVSEAATFTFHVLPLSAEPPRLVRPRMNSQQFSFDLVGKVGGTYRIEATADFSTWTEVKVLRLEKAPTHIEMPGHSFPWRFYRAVER